MISPRRPPVLSLHTVVQQRMPAAAGQQGTGCDAALLLHAPQRVQSICSTLREKTGGHNVKSVITDTKVPVFAHANAELPLVSGIADFASCAPPVLSLTPVTPSSAAVSLAGAAQPPPSGAPAQPTPAASRVPETPRRFCIAASASHALSPRLAELAMHAGEPANDWLRHDGISSCRDLALGYEEEEEVPLQARQLWADASAAYEDQRSRGLLKRLHTERRHQQLQRQPTLRPNWPNRQEGMPVPVTGIAVDTLPKQQLQQHHPHQRR